MPDSEHEPDIETGADTLLDFLEEKSRYSVSQISEDLGIPEDPVEKWARALEKSGLVEIDYSAIKGMVLEYASDKSVDELNRGRHELSLETDTVEINVKDIEEAHEEATDGEGGESEAGFVEKAEEKDTEEGENVEEDKEESGPETSKGSEESTAGSGDAGAHESGEGGESEDTSEGQDVDFGDSQSGSSGEVTDDSGEESDSSVSVSEEDSDESGGPSVTMKAKKAMLNKMKRGSSSEESTESSESGAAGGATGASGGQSSGKNVSEEIDSNLSHIKSKSSGKYKSEEDIDWNPGDDIEEVDQNIKELSDLLLDPEVEDEEIYDRIDYQTEVLKDKLKEEPLEERDNEEELREDIVNTIDTLNEKIEESDSAKSRIKSVIITLKQYMAKIVHAIGIKKVE